ncbi:MAG: YSC84-related protein [Desulfomonilia bacterium]|jgi:lipid-binding SYLF domain-containing protein
MKTTSRLSKISLKTMPLLAACMIAFAAPPNARADSASEINVGADASLASFSKNVNGAKEFLQASKGVLVFPKVYKAGFFWLGGEYGEGALRIDGKTTDYYNIAAGSLGPQLGAQVKTVILVFLQQEALEQFRKSEGWKAGIDGSIAVANVGVGQAIDSTTFKEPIIAFIIDQKGLMYNLTLEGAKFTKISK